MSIIRRLRGAVGLSLAWGSVFVAISASILGILLASGRIPPSFFTPRLVATILVRDFALGVVAGFGFAVLLSRGGRRGSVDGLSSGRVGAWGFAGAAAAFGVAAIALGFARVVSVAQLLAAGVVYGAVGATISVAMLRVARRAPALPNELADDAAPAPRLPT